MYSARRPQAGVYKIRNIVDGKVYIGGTKNLSERRRVHFWRLEHGCNKNGRLQKAYDIYGHDAFCFEVIQTLSPDADIHSVEQKYIDLYRSYDQEHGYNIAPKADSTKGIPCPEKVRNSVSLSNSTRVQSEFARKMSRERTIARNKKNRKASDEEISEMLAMKDSGLPMTKISLMFGLSHGYLQNYISRIEKIKNTEEVSC